MRQSIHSGGAGRLARLGIVSTLALASATVGIAPNGSSARQANQPVPSAPVVAHRDASPVTTSTFTTTTTRPVTATTLPAVVNKVVPERAPVHQPPVRTVPRPQPIMERVAPARTPTVAVQPRSLPTFSASTLPMWARSCPFLPGYRLHPDPRCALLAAYLKALAQNASLVVPATGYELGGYGPPSVPVALASSGGAAWFKAQYARWSRNAWCIISFESIRAGGPVAQNPSGNASGWFQFLDSTWSYFQGYRKARYAPSDVQWWRFFQVWGDGAGRSAWQHPQCW